MLGKLIKNEFVQRYKPVCGLWLLALGVSLLECIMNFIYNNTHTQNEVIENLYMITSITFVAVLIGTACMIVGTSFGDYNKRLFKDQGYLTHTLPVKTETMLLARIAGDLAICFCSAILYPLFMCIGVRDFEMWTDLIQAINDVMLHFNDINYTMLVISILLLLFFGLLLTIWHYYASYAIGHSFSRGKRGASIITYILLYIIGQTTFAVIISAFNKLNLEGYTGLITQYLILSLVFALMTVICFLATNYVCKKKLNLE